MEDGHGFTAACGAKLPLRLSVKNERTGESEDVLIERPWLLIGGDNVCDVRLAHPDVSQRHAYLQFVGSRILCCDLGSRTGTHWTTEIRSRGWLKSGEPIYVGPYSIRLANNDFVLDGSAAPTTARGDHPAPGLPRVSLAFANASSRTSRAKISRITRPVTLVGWSHLCNLRLQHSSVGRVHCSLVWAPDGLWVVDLLCRGGTRVNGKLVSVVRVEEGDELTVGRFHLRVSYAAPVEHGVEPIREVAAGAETGGTDLMISPRIGPHASIGPGNPASSPQEIDFPIDSPAAVPGSGFAAVLGPAPATDKLISPFLDSASGMMGFTPTPLTLPVAHSLSDAVALSLMQQFAVMQQNLFVHTQQLLGVMAHTFSQAHSRQLDLIRDELFRVHEVNRELQELNLKLTVAQEKSRTSEVATVAALPVVAPQPVADQAASDQFGLSSPEATKDTLAEQPLMPLKNTATTASPVPQEPAVLPRARMSPKAADSTRRDDMAPVSPTARADEKAGPDMHVWLCGRINELEQERTSRWQKILNILTPVVGSN